MQDLQTFETEVALVNEEADRLIAEEHPDAETIRSRQQDVNEAFARLKAMAAEREAGLASNFDVQQFNR